MRYRTFHFTHTKKHRYGNPFRFQRLPASSRFGQFTLCAAGLALVSLFYWFFLTPAFAIEKVKIVSTITLPQEEMTQLLQTQLNSRRFRIVTQRNILAFDSRQLSKKISAQFVVEKVNIKKERPHDVALTITERPREAIWSSRGAYFALDAQGMVLGPIGDVEVDKKTVIYDQSGGVPAIKDHVMTARAMAFLSQMIAQERIQALRPQFLSIEKSGADTISLKVGEGWKIHFDMNADLSGQLQALLLALQHSILPDKRDKLDYLDLRFGERVYIKYKE